MLSIPAFGGLITSLPLRNPIANPAAFNFLGVPMACRSPFRSSIRTRRADLTGKIIAKFEDAGLRVIASSRMRLSQADADAF